jgi:hypothetical protein
MSSPPSVDNSQDEPVTVDSLVRILNSFKDEVLSKVQERIGALEHIGSPMPRAISMNRPVANTPVSFSGSHENANFRHNLQLNNAMPPLTTNTQNAHNIHTNVNGYDARAFDEFRGEARTSYDTSRRQSYAQQQQNPANTTSWLQQRMSKILPAPNLDGNYNRNIAVSDASTCQFKLAKLSFPALYYWSNAMMMEQQKYPYEVLQLGHYLEWSVILNIEAFDKELNITGSRMTISGRLIVMNNDELFHLLLSRVLPNSQQEWEHYFENIVKFPKLPPGYIIDIAKWDLMYDKLLQFIYTAKEVTELLNCDPNHYFQPIMKSKGGRRGLIDIVNDLMPMGWGGKILKALAYEQVSACNTLHEYLSLISSFSQSLYDECQQQKVTRNRLFGNSKPSHSDSIDTNVKLNKPFVNYNNNNNYNNNYSNRQSTNTPYANPYNKSNNTNNTLHNMSDIISSHDFPAPSHKNNNEFSNPNLFNINIDEHPSDFDYSDANIDVPMHDSDILNPMYTNPNYDDNYMYAMNNSIKVARKPLSDADAKRCPCYDKLFGICQLSGDKCRYSHDNSTLQKEWDMRNDKHLKSPFARKGPSQGNSNPSSMYNSSDRFSPQIKRRDPPRSATEPSNRLNAIGWAEQESIHDPQKYLNYTPTQVLFQDYLEDGPDPTVVPN